MAYNKTTLNQQEKKWLLDQRITRLTDNNEVLIYPMGAERYLLSVLLGHEEGRYNIKAEIEGKNVLVIPGYGNSAFLFAQSGAKSIMVCDKDPVTIAWIKAFKKYYHYRMHSSNNPSIGELLTALTRWYPPLINLGSGACKNALCWAIMPKSLRRTYIFYMLSLVRHAIESQVKDDFELEKDITFCVGEVTQLITKKKKMLFDTVYVPYLLGVKNGIERAEDVVNFIKKLTEIVPNGHILVTPTQERKEFKVAGQTYFLTTGYTTIQKIPGLKPYSLNEDRHWFKMQGLAVFKR